MHISHIAFLTSLVVSFNVFASGQPDWTESATVPAGGRGNIYLWSEGELASRNREGRLHAQIYPVSVTGILPPYEPFKRVAEADPSNPAKEFLNGIFRRAAGIENFDQILEYVGLHPYPQPEDRGVYQVPYPDGVRPDTRVGFGTMERKGAVGFTFSCAACHSGNLFGKTVLGLTNRFPRANDFFVDMKSQLTLVSTPMFQLWTGASHAEAELFSSAKKSLNRVTAKRPLVLGLDTSLAQVGLSLNRRAEDEWASPSRFYEQFPRSDEYLDDKPADSKPAVWWNLKYKNRWLSDGSVVSGNPIFTNFIWNEIGRGADVRELAQWLDENKQVVEELTTAVFASEAPLFTDFFPASKIDLDRAKRGEKIFVTTCARCHGNYDKAWNTAGADALSDADKLKTTLVRPPAKTPVVDVGTDSHRRRGMKSLERLNDLAISKANGVVIKEQAGYVPPPLVGIWARWPYFHNNSAPSLCAVLTPAPQRPKGYYAGEASDRERDFDSECNGYPLGEKTPADWKQDKFRYDTRRRGLSNSGHDEGIFLKNGKEILSPEDKRDLIQFLQTL